MDICQSGGEERKDKRGKEMHHFISVFVQCSAATQQQRAVLQYVLFSSEFFANLNCKNTTNVSQNCFASNCFVH